MIIRESAEKIVRLIIYANHVVACVIIVACKIEMQKGLWSRGDVQCLEVQRRKPAPFRDVKHGKKAVSAGTSKVREIALYRADR